MTDKKHKIVIVDDDFINLDILCCELSDLYEIYPVSDGLSSLHMFEDIMPDLIILDIMMPEIDGISIYIAQQNNPILRHIPVIFVTAIEDGEYEAQLLQWGASAYITKPYDMQEIRAKIRSQIESASEKNAAFASDR